MADAGVAREMRGDAQLVQRLREARAAFEPGRPADGVPRTDDEVTAAVRELARGGVIAGASGAASLAGALVACADETLRARLGVTADSQVAVVNSEGATDPASYAAILAG